MSRIKPLRILRRDESKHFLTIGDTGVGKTQFIKQILRYAEACGDTCVVLDSKLEFIPEFYRPERGDKILSPKDARCVYWDIGEEVVDEAEAVSVMRALYPTHPNNPYAHFFDDQACKIAAYLLTYSRPRPSCGDYAYWLARPEEILKRVAGSEHEQTLSAKSPNMLNSILATMNTVGYALRMMPSDRFSRERFTVREWARDRRGWLFLPNTADTREALRPLQSAWADMAMLRVMSSQEQKRRVWVVLDELDSLNAIPKLIEGMTMMRSTGNVLVLGMQNTAQLEDRYGRQADTIFSQAGTKLILAVSEPKSAKTLQDLFGEIEIRRYRESRTGSFFGRRDRNNFSGPEDIRKPLLLASEIQGLPDLTGYFCQRPADQETGLHVVPVRLPYFAPIHRHPALVERVIPPIDRPISYVATEVEAAPLQPLIPSFPGFDPLAE
jgi:type IV secretory pathway TraG/TraD family ATPase VirD4